MSSAKKRQSVSDQIHDILKPKDLTEEADENEARFEEFTEHDTTVQQLSSIRKQTAQSLNELDQKYEGKAVSRKELEREEDSSEEGSPDDEATDDDGNYATDSDEDMESNEEVEEEDDDEGSDSEEVSGSEEDDEDYGDDFDLSQFTKQEPSVQSAAVMSGDKTKILNDESVDEEIKKGICVQNQLKIWEKLLEVRIKSQKMLITANSLPDFDSHLELSTMEDSEFSDKVEKACDGIHGLLDNLLELQSTLVNR